MKTFEIHECPNPSQPLGLGSSEGLGPTRWTGLVTTHERGGYVAYGDYLEAMQTRDAKLAELREAARAFYNATIAAPGVRLSSQSAELRDIAKAAGEELRALLVDLGPNVRANRPTRAAQE
jgi:hypothetical protein